MNLIFDLLANCITLIISFTFDTHILVYIDVKEKGRLIMQSKSIGKRLKKVKSYQVQHRILSEWVKNWKGDFDTTIKKLRWATQKDDHSEIMHIVKQLEGMSEKMFTVLNNVLFTLSDPNRKLDVLSVDKADDTKNTTDTDKSGMACDVKRIYDETK